MIIGGPSSFLLLIKLPRLQLPQHILHRRALILHKHKTYLQRSQHLISNRLVIGVDRLVILPKIRLYLNRPLLVVLEGLCGIFFCVI